MLFKTLDVDFLSTLANLMQTRVYNDNDYIIRKGEVGRAMFFVLRGTVEVVSEDGMMIDSRLQEAISIVLKYHANRLTNIGETAINVMDEESFFGEIGVLFSVPR